MQRTHTYTHTHTHTHTVCCNLSQKEYSSLLGISPLTKYFYDVKRMFIYVMETTDYIARSNEVSNLRENAPSDDTPRVGDGQFLVTGMRSHGCCCCWVHCFYSLTWWYSRLCVWGDMCDLSWQVSRFDLWKMVCASQCCFSLVAYKRSELPGFESVE